MIMNLGACCRVFLHKLIKSKEMYCVSNCCTPQFNCELFRCAWIDYFVLIWTPVKSVGASGRFPDYLFTVLKV